MLRSSGQPAYTNNWTTGEWSACSLTKEGHCIQTRTVVCHDENMLRNAQPLRWRSGGISTACKGQRQPASSQECEICD